MPDDEFMTVEEVAAEAGVSVATVRRWCSSGTVNARKRGRQWVIRADSVPSAAPRRTVRPAPSAGLDPDLAAGQLARRDARELWVPDVLALQDYLAAGDRYKAEALTRIENAGPFDLVTDVDLPKTEFFTRASALLSFPDRLAYHTCVASLAASIDRDREPTVFSARRSTDTRYLLQNGRDLFLAWRKAVMASIRSGSRWMTSTDIAAYFDNIQIKLLIEDIRTLHPPPLVVRALGSMLNEWSSHRGVGIPQGPDASRLLGNFYLHSIDRTMVGLGVGYFRYMDDIRVTAPTRRAAILALRELERLCRSRGLTLAAQKTDLLVGDDALNSLVDHELNGARYLVETRRHAAARAALKRVYRSSVRTSGGVKIRHARFSLWRLRALRDDSVLKYTLANLEHLGPIASIAAAYLIPWISRRSVERGIAEFLSDTNRNIGSYMSTWLMAAMLHHPGPIPAQWVVYSRGISRDRNEAVYHRAVAANVVVLGGRVEDIRWIEEEIRREFDPTLLRGYLVALARIGRLTKAVRSAASSRSRDAAVAAQYLVGMNRLPSLVYHDQSVPVRGL